MSAAPAPAGAPAGVDLGRHPSGVVPILQNVVATVNLGTKLDLKAVALHARNAEYNPKRFAAVIMRIREPKTTALIFASGKMVVTGAKSEDDARTAARKYAKIVQKLGFPAQFKEFKIQNMVGSCDVKFPIRLEGLAYQQSLFSSYEPELFPGLIYRMKSPKIVLLIFVSGKVVLTGGKKRDDIYDAFENIYPVLCGFRKGDATVAGMALPAAGQARALGAPASAGAAGSVGAGPSSSMGPPPPVNLSAGAGPSDAGQQHEMQLPPPTPLHPSLPPPTPAHAPVASMLGGGPSYLPPPTPMR